MGSPLPSKFIVCTGSFFVAIVASGEYSINARMEDNLKGHNWQRMKQDEETRNNAIKSVCYDPVLNTFLKVYLSDTASYQKSVSCCFFLNGLQYDKIISNISMINELEEQQKVIQMYEERQKLIKTIIGTMECDMELRRRYENKHMLMYGSLDVEYSERETQSMLVVVTLEE